MQILNIAVNKNYDAIVVGAGAAGLMAAIQAGKHGKKILLIEATDKIGEKIRISGGGVVILLIYIHHLKIIFQIISILPSRPYLGIHSMIL